MKKKTLKSKLQELSHIFLTEQTTGLWIYYVDPTVHHISNPDYCQPMPLMDGWICDGASNMNNMFFLPGPQGMVSPNTYPCCSGCSNTFMEFQTWAEEHMEHLNFTPMDYG